MKKSTVLILFFLAVSSWMMAQADTTQFEEVIVQGNRLEIPFNQSTRNIEIITQEMIRTLPVNSINELLSYIGGVDIRQRGPFGTQADISIDGGSFEQVLILLNGVKLLDAQTAHLMMNIPVPLESIAHIEILKGPAARVYGINSLTGAINIVTKKSSKSFVSVHTYAGSSFEKKEEGDGDGIYMGGGVQVTGNYGNAKQNHLLSVSKDRYNGQRYNTAQDNIRLFYNGNYKLNENHSLQWMSGYIYNDFGANGFYAAPGDKESNETVETSLFSLSSEHKIGRFTVSPKISNRYTEDDYRYLGKEINLARSKHYTNALMAEVNGSVKTKIGDFGLSWESRLGKINSSNIGQHTRDNHGISTEYKGVFWRKLIANAGVYVNYNTNYGWQTYPGIDMAYLFLPNWKVSANAGSGQRIPSFTDLYLNQLPGNIGNPNLKPENAWSYEGNIQYAKNGFKIKAGYFYRAIDDYIDWVRTSPTLPYSPINIGENLVQGINMSIHQKFKIKNTHALGYAVSYNYLNPSYQKVENVQSKYILESLKHQFIAGITYSYKDFSIQVSNRFIERELNKPYNLLDVRVNYNIQSFSIYTDITNILNAEYVEAGAVPMPPRWFTLGVRYLWNEK